MRIVVLDGYTLNPGDLTWDALKDLGDCDVYDRTEASDVISRAKDAEVLMTNKTPLPREAIEQLPRLAYIGVLATGYNIVDAEAASQRNIPVTNVPTYGTKSVAQMTLALLLELAQHVGLHAQTVRDGEWARNPDFSYWKAPLVELEGLTMGIVGYGRIGRAVGDLAAAFGMKLLIYSRHEPAALPTNARFVGLESLLKESDVVSLHCPLTSQNQGMINEQRLGLMKPSAFLLNTSRGPLIDEQALAEALTRGTIAGAGLDVLSVEPPSSGSPLFQAPNCYITPHIAWATRSARARLMQTAVDNVRAFLDGQPQNVVNQG